MEGRVGEGYGGVWVRVDEPGILGQLFVWETPRQHNLLTRYIKQRLIDWRMTHTDESMKEEWQSMGGEAEKNEEKKTWGGIIAIIDR